MTNRESQFAEPTLSTGARHKHFKLVKGSNRYRIGPAYGSLAASGRWNVSIRQHYGYKVNGDEQNPNGYVRTFLCIEENNKQKIVTQHCAECDDTSALQEKVEAREARIREEGKDDANLEEKIATVLGSQKKYLKEHNRDSKHVVLAKNEDNEWGVLWLPWKALEALINLRKKVISDEGIDILSTKDGAWVDFSRNGEGFRNTSYTCDVVAEIITTDSGKKAKVTKQEALTDADFDAIVETCPDLSTIGTRLTAEQIERLVESRGDVDIVEAVFNEAKETKRGGGERSPTPGKVTNRPAAKAPPVDNDHVAPGAQKFSNEDVALPVKKSTPQPEAIVEVDEMAALRAKLAAMEAKLAVPKAETKPAPIPKAEPKPTPGPMADPNDMSDDEFMKVYGKK